MEMPLELHLEDSREEQVKSATRIVEEILSLLKIRIRALIFPLNVFRLKPVTEEITICTDGLQLFFDPDYILRTCELPTGRRIVAQKLAHIAFHGLLGHFEIWDGYSRTELISTVMDLQVDKLMQLVGMKTSTDRFGEEWEYYGLSLYYRALRDREICKELKRSEADFVSDDHRVWMCKDAVPEKEDAAADKQKKSEKNGAPKAKGSVNRKKGGKGSGIVIADREEVAQAWAEVREGMFGDVSGEIWMMLEDVVQAEASWGSGSGDVDCMIKVCPSKPNPYRELLQKLMSLNEYVKERDSIDPAIYQYGLSLYGDVPLIEPLEYTEEKQLDYLVIALDTSGSCEGRTMELFIRDTAAMLRDIGAGTVFQGIYLLQCDCTIQKEEYYEDIYTLQSSMGEIYPTYGYGGTDFRPVFQRIGELEEEEKKITALLYFSDGMGDYPDEAPAYPVYYIIPEYELCEEEAYLKEIMPEWVETVPLALE